MVGTVLMKIPFFINVIIMYKIKSTTGFNLPIRFDLYVYER